MLVPLETLPGWPPAPNPPVLHALGVIFGIPILLGLVIAGLAYVSSGRDLRLAGPPVHPVNTYADPAAVTAAAETGPASIEGKPGADADTGGTSARW